MENQAIILPISNITLLPGVATTLKINQESKAYLDILEKNQDEFIALPLKKRGTTGHRHPEDFYPYGVRFSVTRLKHHDDHCDLIIRTHERVEIAQLYMEGSLVMAHYAPAVMEKNLSEQSYEEMVGYMKNTVNEMLDGIRGGQFMKKTVSDFRNMNSLIVYLSQYMQISAEEKYELLAAQSQKDMALTFMDYLMRQKETIKLNLEVNERFSERANQMYRQQALRQQLKVIQDELNEGNEDGPARDDYVSRIEKACLPQEVYKTAMEEARKLESAQAGSMDASVSEKYLEFILALPWQTQENQTIDLKEARQILNQDHYGLQEVKDRIIQHLAVMQLKNENKGSVLLLIGPPGTGKTSLGRSVAKALGRQYIRMSLGGVRDEAEIRGHRRTYVGAMPGRILESIKRAGTTNPLIVLDEIDKMSPGGYSGDPASAMLEVLDPAQNNTFTDHYLDLPYDLSNVFFIATANSYEGIPGPLLDRMEVIDISGYTPDEKFHIGREHLYPAVMEECGMKPGQLSLSDELLKLVISEYTAEAGVRGLRRQLARIVRTYCEDVLGSQDMEPVKIDAGRVEKALGHRVARHQKAGQANPAGVATGLAWTPVGGEILFIETTDMPGQGHVTITGQLGDVMKESAQISLSLLKSRMPVNSTFFKEKDLHIHVPNGATPKDGPSAGITLCTALASLVTGIPVSSQLAMTGEITLRGDVMPIGGLKEKLYGAQRAGIKKVLIPIDNESDLKDVPDEVLSTLEVIPVTTIEDVLREALGIDLPRVEHVLLDTAQGGVRFPI